MAVSLIAVQAGHARADGLPSHVGECSTTQITFVGARLKDMPESGSTVVYANGGRQVSYSVVAPIAASRIGDSVEVCLVSLPAGCPPGDHRGSVYRGTNLRTNGHWELPDSQHVCGGA